MKGKYTERIHVQRLIKMLNKKDPCNCCPAAYYYAGHNLPYIMWDIDKQNPCVVCTKFVEIYETIGAYCPCNVLGKERAIKRTWEMIEEKYPELIK
uniref:Uncharacterized protein n=1 Tax=viral metagenome TaxID=1070528 RepID=A0A6M3IPF8_9ZZZZ